MKSIVYQDSAKWELEIKLFLKKDGIYNFELEKN